MISQRQTMKMQQKLSPQQLMLMQMLQLPVTELEKTLKEEVEKNPLLEITDEAPAQMEPLPSVDEGENLMLTTMITATVSVRNATATRTGTS